MLGLIFLTAPEGGRRGAALGERRILGMTFVWAAVRRGPRTPETVARRRAAAAAKRLRRLGVSRAVLPEGFPWEAQIEKAGLAPVSTVPLRQALAGQLARAAGGGNGAAVAGDRPSGELVRTVTELALGNRYVSLDLPYGAGEVARRLRREYGVSLLLTPEGAPPPEVLVLFAPRPELEGRAKTVLRLYDEAAPLPPLLLPPELERQLPEGVSRPQLLSALVEGGALRPGQITVGQG